MKNRFITILGTGKYNECIYKFKNNLFETRFIQEAVINIMCRSWDWNKDMVNVFMTEKARGQNWFNLNDKNRRLKEILQDKRVHFEEVQIPEGKTEEELWEIHDAIFNVIGKNENIVFDITHGLRSIPLQALVVLNYAKAIKGINIGGIYYGAYEVREKACNKVITPIFDLTPFNELLNQINLK